MNRALLLVSAVLAGSSAASADSWACPGEQDCPCEGGGFVAHVTPASEKAKARLEVLRVSESGREPLWTCDLGNEGQPESVLVSKDGRHVATVNECSRRVHGGMGEFVVAFYNEKGLVRSYSLEEVLHYPSRIDEKELQRLVTRSVSGRSWATAPTFLDESEGDLFLCVWLLHGKGWLAWDARSGEEIEPGEALLERWFERGRRWARRICERTQGWVSALEFLRMYGKTEDRAVFVTLLEDHDFRTECVLSGNRFSRYECSSQKRALAERALAQWDGRGQSEGVPRDQDYRYLGVVRGTMELPQAPQEEDGPLGVYLFPADTPVGDWHERKPAYRLVVRYGKYTHLGGRFPGTQAPFRFAGITPGTYRLKAIWDRTRPYSIDEARIKGPPGKGDWESALLEPFEVKAGEEVAGVTVRIDTASRPEGSPSEPPSRDASAPGIGPPDEPRRDS